MSAALLASGRADAQELTAESAGERAARSSFEAAASGRARAAAEARVDQAAAAYLPRVALSARYTRLSDFRPSPLFPFGLAATEAPAGTPGPASVSTGPIAIAPVLDNYALDATLTLPLSDYVLRLARGLEAAKHGRDVASWESVIVRSRARLAGKTSFFEWVRATAAAEAAQKSVAEQRGHLGDVTTQLSQGRASRADALRVESALAGAEATLAEAEAQRTTAETRLRTVLHLADGRALTTTEPLDSSLAPVSASQAEWLAEAYRTRAELRGLDAAASAARSQAGVARATYLPTIGAFASATYANPNPRYFPPEAAWHGTWAAGLSATWTPTDIPGARASATEAEARAEALEAQRNALRDALAVEVTHYLSSARAADAKIIATDRQLQSATEAHRVTLALFANGRATTSHVLDAEADLARARLGWVNARLDARVARARLDHAAGRDQEASSP